MSKKIHQFTAVENGVNLLEDYFPVIKLGIQGKPNTEFKINGGSVITIGYSGIYELDLTNLGGLIYSLVFTNIGEDDNIVVDIIYEGGSD